MATDRKVWEVSMGPSNPLGHAELTVSTVALGLSSPPATARRVVIRTVGQPINWRDDGVDPTSTTGMALLADETLVFDGDATTIKFIRASSATGDADVRIAYYGND